MIPFPRVVRKAEAAFGLVITDLPYWQFLTEPDANGNRHRIPPPSAFVKEDGSFEWEWFTYERVTPADLIRTRELGHFTGDPHTVELQLAPWGDGGFLLWEDFLETFADLARSFVFGKAVVAVLKGRYKQWKGRGATSPAMVLQVILQHDIWAVATLAIRLRITNDEAATILEQFGYGARWWDELHHRRPHQRI